MVFGISQYSPLDIDIMIPEGLSRTLSPSDTSDVCYLPHYQKTASRYTFVFSTADELRKLEFPILDLDKNGLPIILRPETIRKVFLAKPQPKPKTQKPKPNRKVKKNGRKK